MNKSYCKISSFLPLYFSIIFSVILLMAGCSNPATGQNADIVNNDFLQAACVKIDITPDQPQWLRGYGPRKSVGVHDRLYHKIAVIDNGKDRCFIISSDLCSYPTKIYHEFCRKLEKITGIKEEQIWWTVTHTHAAPLIGNYELAVTLGKPRSGLNPEYTEWVQQKLIEGIIEVQSHMVPARMYIGSGKSMANINRRQEDDNGKIILGRNPDGPVDRKIGIIKLQSLDGSPIAIIANYAVHGTMLSHHNNLITGDLPGLASEYAAKITKAPVLFINGAQGNLSPDRSRGESFLKDFQNEEIDVLVRQLGEDISEAAANSTVFCRQVNLKRKILYVETPWKADTKLFDKLSSSYSRQLDNGERIARLPVYLLQLNNDAVIWAAPVELFCEIALEVRKQSPFENTFYFGLTNGFMYYLVTKESFAQGGYEPSMTPFTEQAEDDLTNAVVNFLQNPGKYCNH